MKKLLLYFLLSTGCNVVLYAQQIPIKGVPRIDSYRPTEYKNHGKIWDICAAPNGLLYLAGDGGLLEHDGKVWKGFKGSDGFTRSLYVANDSLIYSGSDRDFGVWKRNQFQQFEYTSLYPFRKDSTEQNEEFWDIHLIRDKVIFVSFNNIYIYTKNQLTKIAAPHRFAHSFETATKLFIADEQNGLYSLEGSSLKPIFTYPKGSALQIIGVFERPNNLLIVTKNRGLYTYNLGELRPVQNQLSDHLKRNQVFCATHINDQYYAFGTILNGLYIADLDGNILQHINKQKGLLNNTLLSMYYDPLSGILWLGMDYGVAALHIHHGLTYFHDYQGDFGTAHTALLQDGTFYLGTNQGLYRAAWNDLNNDASALKLSLIPGSEGQVWTLAEIDGIIWCGHDQGLFRLDGNRFERVHNEPGVWTLLRYNEEYLLTGNYNGVSVLKKQGEAYVFFKKLDLILGSCNQLLLEKENLVWVNIPNFGLIRFRLNASLNPENRKIFPIASFSGKGAQLLKDSQGIHLLTDKYDYLFDPAQQRFVQQKAKVSLPAVQDLLSNVYHPLTIDQEHEFYPVYNGFALNTSKIVLNKKTAFPPPLFRKSLAFNNHIKLPISQNTVIPYRLNNLQFNYTVPQREGVLYQYLLENFTQEWSPWNGQTTLDLLNLKEGSYTLKMRAKNEGKISPIVSFSFRIAPPWYRSGPANLAYALILLLAFYLNRQVQNRRLNQQKEQLLKKERSALQLQAEQYEREAMQYKQQQLEHEKDLLRQQIKQKGIELAKQAKENEDKNRLLHLLKEKMEEAQHAPNISKLHWAEMKRLLDLYLENKDKTFEIQIDELHQAFFQKLKTEFPDLSLYDLRLCVYLKIGLNSKEISDILQVLPSSINVSRSRLRKKLNLQPDEDLYNFLNQF